MIALARYMRANELQLRARVKELVVSAGLKDVDDPSEAFQRMGEKAVEFLTLQALTGTSPFVWRDGVHFDDWFAGLAGQAPRKLAKGEKLRYGVLTTMVRERVRENKRFVSANALEEDDPKEIDRLTIAAADQRALLEAKEATELLEVLDPEPRCMVMLNLGVLRGAAASPEAIRDCAKVAGLPTSAVARLTARSKKMAWGEADGVSQEKIAMLFQTTRDAVRKILKEAMITMRKAA